MTGYESKKKAAQDKLVVTDIDGHVVRDVRKKRTWVGLTEEDIALIDWESLVSKKDCVRVIEAKLKDKNNGT